MEFTSDQFNNIKNEAEDFYNKIGFAYCPYFAEKVNFNAKGLEHLIFKTWNRTRSIDDQFSRFRHLRLVPEVIKNSKTLQGICPTQKFERIKKKDGTWQQVLKVATYYEFISVLESHGSKVRVKVIVKQIERGEKFFLSIIPFWGTNKNGERIMYNGHPETD